MTGIVDCFLLPLCRSALITIPWKEQCLGSKAFIQLLGVAVLAGLAWVHLYVQSVVKFNCLHQQRQCSSACGVAIARTGQFFVLCKVGNKHCPVTLCTHPLSQCFRGTSLSLQHWPLSTWQPLRRILFLSFNKCR